MSLEDAAAVPWMAKFTRNPFPKRVVWCQGDVAKTAFYWLGVPADEAAKGKTVTAQVSGNTVEILSCDYTSLTVYLNDALVDLDRPVRVECGGNVLFEGKLDRSPATMRQTLAERGDTSYIFPASVTVKLP